MANELAAVPESKATTRITVSKDQAASLKIGLAVRLEVAGEIKEISRCYNDKEKYDLVLEEPIVKNIGEEEKDESDDSKEESTNEKKDSLATISKEELKKLISKED